MLQRMDHVHVFLQFLRFFFLEIIFEGWIDASEY